MQPSSGEGKRCSNVNTLFVRVSDQDDDVDQENAGDDDDCEIW